MHGCTKACQTNVLVFAALLQYIYILYIYIYIYCLYVDMYVCLIFELARERQRYCLVIFSPNNLQSASQQETFSNTVDTLFKCHRICVSLEITAFLRGLPSSFPKKYSIQSRLQFIKKKCEISCSPLESWPYANCLEGVVSSPASCLRSDVLEGSQDVENLCLLNKAGENLSTKVYIQ